MEATTEAFLIVTFRYMKIQTEEITITLNNQECRDLLFSIKRSLEASIKEHYSCLQQADLSKSKGIFNEQCRERLNMMKDLMMACSGSDSGWMETELWSLLEKEYNKRNPSKLD